MLFFLAYYLCIVISTDHVLYDLKTTSVPPAQIQLEYKRSSNYETSKYFRLRSAIINHFGMQNAAPLIIQRQ